MQWPDATVSADEGVATAARFESRPSGFEAVGVVEQQGVAVSVATLVTGAGVPSGLDLPCTEDPELFFAETPAGRRDGEGALPGMPGAARLP